MGIRASRPTWTATILPSLTHRRTVSGWRPKRFATSPERSIRVFSVRITRIYYSHYSNLSTVVNPFLQQPLFIITGASGTGKSTVCLSLTPLLKECVVLEQAILRGVVPATSEDNYSDYRNVWLRVTKNVGQAGRPVVLCGTALPEQFEECPERRYFSTLHYLTFVCNDDVLVDRLKRRPGWRMSYTPEFLENML